MKKIISFTVFFLLGILTHAQTLKKEIIASAGTSSFSPFGVGASWTIGEPMIASYSNTVHLFEGFHMPEDELNTDVEAPVSRHSISLFPNPNYGVFQIELRAYKKPIYYEVLNTNGIQISQGYLTEDTWFFDISEIPAAVYYLNLKNNSLAESISFVKL